MSVLSVVDHARSTAGVACEKESAGKTGALLHRTVDERLSGSGDELVGEVARAVDVAQRFDDRRGVHGDGAVVVGRIARFG
jgi:hypothetical protein